MLYHITFPPIKKIIIIPIDEVLFNRHQEKYKTKKLIKKQQKTVIKEKKMNQKQKKSYLLLGTNVQPKILKSIKQTLIKNCLPS